MNTEYKTKKIIARKVPFTSKLGKIFLENVEVKVPDLALNSKTFDPSKHDYSISSDDIYRASILIAREFFDKNMVDIHLRNKELSAEEVSGIRIVLGVDGSELATLLGINKGTVSKILAGKIKIKTPESILLMSYLKKKLDDPTIDWSDLLEDFKQEEPKAIKVMIA